MTWETVARRQTNLADVHFAHTAQWGRYKGTKVRPRRQLKKHTCRPYYLVPLLVGETQLFETLFIRNLMQYSKCLLC